MPSSEAGSDEMDDRKNGKYEVQKDDDYEDPKKGGSAASDDGDRNNRATGGDVDIPKRLHAIFLTGLVTCLICLLAIIPSRSLAVSKANSSYTAGAFDIVHGSNTVLQCDEEGLRTGCGVMGIICIIVTLLMVILGALEFSSPGRFSWFAKVQCALWHVLWVFLLITWAIWASVLDKWHGKCGNGSPVHQFYYAWGFVFLVAMWLVHLIFAVMMTLKAMGKKVCGM